MAEYVAVVNKVSFNFVHNWNELARFETSVSQNIGHIEKFGTYYVGGEPRPRG